jgi:uncharacterized protein YlxW (UPF0749 family)
MSLLTQLVEGALDEGYAEAAERRAQQPAGGPRRPTWVLAGGLLMVGLLLATAAAQVRDRAPAAAEARKALNEEIQQRTAAIDRLEDGLQKQRASVEKARADALSLTSDGTEIADQLSNLEAVTGAGAVKGPGLVIHLEDAKADVDESSQDPRDEEARAQGRVSDRDLQTIVNEVWAAGAEAVAINGQRLTARSAIRSAGEAVLVDFRPLSPPYDIVAVGDGKRLRSTVVDGFGGSYLQVLHSYGISFSMATKDSVVLPAAAGIPARYAHVPPSSEEKP